MAYRTLPRALLSYMPACPHYTPAQMPTCSHARMPKSSSRCPSSSPFPPLCQDMLWVDSSTGEFLMNRVNGVNEVNGVNGVNLSTFPSPLPYHQPSWQDMLWVDFPRGEFLMNRVNGVNGVNSCLLLPFTHPLSSPLCQDTLWVDFPRGEFLMNRVNGVKASLFLPCHPLRGVLQVEGRTADTATVGFAYQHPLGTRVTPSFSLADRGVSVEVLQPITVRQLGPAVKPEAQIRFKTTVSGTRQGWEMETTRFLGTNEIVGGAAEASQGGLAVSVGYKAGVAPVAFFTLF
ncbi:unnamed protein product, partial [Closterium sp. NIES-54]